MNKRIKMTIPDRKNQLLVKFILFLILAVGLSLQGQAQVLDGPDPHQMEDVPDLGFKAVEHGLDIPADLEMGAPSSVVWTPENHLVVFNRGPNPLMEFDAEGGFIRSWGQGDCLRPHGMRLDPEGNIWTTDENGHTVRKMNLAGEILKLDENGKPLAGTGEPGKKLREFGEAHYMTITPTGDIFVADTIKPDLHKFVEI